MWGEKGGRQARASDQREFLEEDENATSGIGRGEKKQAHELQEARQEHGE